MTSMAIRQMSGQTGRERSYLSKPQVDKREPACVLQQPKCGTASHYTAVVWEEPKNLVAEVRERH